MSAAIKFENISKQYRLGEVGTGTLSHDLHRAWAKLRGKPDPFAKVGQVNDRTKSATKNQEPGAKNISDADYVWALKDINFEVEQGEILGIIGRNGAGKSTLLKLLSRVTAPTTGSIRAKGRIASLLEVGTGFHPELTGRENIYLNGAILGMRRHEITRQLDEIVEFSGCTKYIDTPVKRYSSGMTVRLGFAVAAHLDCEILVVDEVLAVGDAEFQKKCMGKMKEVSRQKGKTILFVSHNLGVVAQLCKTGIVLTNGKTVFADVASEACRFYTNGLSSRLSSLPLKKEIKGEKILEFTSACICNSENECVSSIDYGSDAYLRIEYFVSRPGSSYSISAELLSLEAGVILTSTSLDSRPINELGEYLETGHYIAELKLPTTILRDGIYEIKIASTIPGVIVLDQFPTSLTFEVNDLSSPIAVLGEGRRGLILPRLDWSINHKKCFKP